MLPLSHPEGNGARPISHHARCLPAMINASSDSTAASDANSAGHCACRANMMNPRPCGYCAQTGWVP